ncbi:hypothetical protein BU23DRAFT_594172 [Bimuria novae-zelandiae CBS 107.79]|uniref:Methyltransferase type 11 domain-containing protein n=1 Tax=Bimuria novae-zelandiae CBS 107.79 TaxID=1447943 RepID=A0A6A5UHI6_9PLEO|nr:hypothetical protein BU23DRAFT_594172 [Bimuria novae-zelandiae CBS 107.79]
MGAYSRDRYDRVFAAKDQEESRKLYDQWASSYDADMQTFSFTAPRIVADGLAGAELGKLGFQTIGGLDLSESMLKVAEKTSAYRHLKIADLTKRLDTQDGAYDALTCSGTFTHEHLGPDLLTEFARVVKAGDAVKKLKENKTVEVLGNNSHNYRKFGEDESGGLVLVLRKL